MASKKPVPMLDLSGEFEELKAEWYSLIDKAGKKGAFILGDNVTRFEKESARYIGAKHAIGVANGTDALQLSLRALGIGKGDRVITTPWTFFATAEVISEVGATPVFVDIEPGSFCIDPEQIKKKITKTTKAIMPVHIFGHPANMDAISALAEEHGLALIEDAAQAFGAKAGRQRVGGIGDTGCFSFYPTKVLGCYGDGGLITTNSDELNDHIRRLRNHGASAPFMHEEIGYNSRLDEVQAALLRLKLKGMNMMLDVRQRIADYYDEQLDGLDLTTPPRPAKGRHAFNLYTIRSYQRDAIREAFEEQKIGHSICYPAPLHLQKVYENLKYKSGSLPVAEQASEEVISLPIYHGMSQQQAARVCEVIREAIG